MRIRRLSISTIVIIFSASEATETRRDCLSSSFKGASYRDLPASSAAAIVVDVAPPIASMSAIQI